MKNYFYKINGKYIESFSRNVLSRFKGYDIRTDASFLKAILRELNTLFKSIGGKVSSKDDIPKAGEYPDSNKFNKLILNIGDDIQKLYTSQKLIEDDVNNLMNFNSSQRSKTFENFTSVQQLVYATYIKNKKGISGEVIVPAGNPFISSDNLGTDSNGVFIDQTRNVLTLDCVTNTQKPADLSNINVFFAGKIPLEPLYPSNKALGIGQHWKIPGQPPTHFIDSKSVSEVSNYKQLLIDDPGNNLGVGWCEYEAVSTTLTWRPNFNFKRSYRLVPNEYGQFSFSQMISVSSINSAEQALKSYIGIRSQQDPELIYLDVNNSLQGKYINQSMFMNISFSEELPQYKLVIPFKSNCPITNEIVLDFEPDANGYYPKIAWSKSKVFSNQSGADLSYGLIIPSDQNRIPENGIYSCQFQGGFIKPSRLELFLEYGSDDLHWYPIGFYMSHYMYNASQTYFLESGDNEKISLILGKNYDVYVDTEADEEAEKARALNVLLSRGK